MFIELQQTLIIRKEVNSLSEVTLPVLPEDDFCSFQANFKLEKRIHSVVLVGRYLPLVRKSHPDIEYKSLCFLVFEERDATEDMSPIMSIILPIELFPKRIYFRSSSCTQCIHKTNDNALQCKLHPERISSCLTTNIIIDGDEMEAHEIHSHCNRKGQREFIMHLIDTVGLLYNKVLENENNQNLPSRVRGVKLSELYTYRKKEEDREKELKQLQIERQLEQCKKNGFYAVISDDRAVLHFRYNGKDYHRTRKCSRDTAIRTLVDLHKHIVKGEEPTHVVSTIMKSIRTAPVISIRSEEPVTEEIQEPVLSEVEMLRKQVADLEKERDELKNSLYLTKTALSNLQPGKVSKGDLYLNLTCDELFEDEVKYQILSILQYYKNQVNKGGVRITRRLAVIDNLLLNNSVPDLRAQLKDKLTNSILQLQNNPVKLQSSLQALGYEVEKNGQGHWFVYPKGHKEYGVSLSSTPSDVRSRRNEIARLLNILF